jgi:hypothetical protein
MLVSKRISTLVLMSILLLNFRSFALPPPGYVEQQKEDAQLIINGVIVGHEVCNVIALGKARCLLQGESPCRVRANHSPVSSVDPTAESVMANNRMWGKRTQRIL